MTPDFWLFAGWVVVCIVAHKVAAHIYSKGVQKGVDVAIHNLTKAHITLDVIASKDGVNVEVIIDKVGTVKETS